MATSTTYQALVPEIARHVYAGKSVIDVTGTGTAVGTVVVASRAYTDRSPNAYDGMGWFCYSGGGSAPEAEFVRVVKGGFDGTTGTWTVSPAWTAAPGFARNASSWPRGAIATRCRRSTSSNQKTEPACRGSKSS